MSTEGKSKLTRHPDGEAELLRHAADVVIELGVDGRIIYLSDAVEKILARPADSFTGRSFLEIVVPEDRAHTLAAFQKVIATGSEPMVRFRVVRSDGLRVEFEATARAFETAGQRRVVCVARDITQQSAESAVTRQRDDHYRTIVEAGGRPAAIIDKNGVVIFSNQVFKNVFGREVSLEDIFNRMTTEVRHSMETAWYESNRADRPGNGTGDFAFETDDGSEVWFAASWEPFQNEDDQRNFAVLYEDISPRKQVELALRSIAQGIAAEGRLTLRSNIELIAHALGFDRLVLGELNADDPTTATIVIGWESHEFLERGQFELGGLPDATVAAGEACVFPSGVAQLVPEVAERFGPGYECYAGLPLKRADGTILGFVGGYGRSPLFDSDLARSLLAAFATHAAAAIDRQRADAEIRANQDRFDVLARQGHDLLTEIGIDGRIRYASEAYRTMLGYRPEEMVGKFVPDMFHPDDRALNIEAQSELFAGADHTYAMTRVRHASGGWRWLESRTSAFSAPDGTHRALILSRDVTDKRHKELGRDLLYRVLQEGADLVLVCDPDGTLLFTNDAARRLLGASAGDFSPQDGDSTVSSMTDAESDGKPAGGRHLSEFLSDEDAHRLITKILPQLTPAQPWSGELHVLSTETEEPIPTEATVFRFLGDRDSGAGYLAVTLRDIEARRTAEKALRESEFRLNQARKMEAVGRLAGGIAHDFNNLLTAIIGYSDLVIDELGDGHVARRDAEEILRAAERAGGLTRQLLAFSRRQVIQPEPVDLNAVVANIDRMMRRLIGENIELVTFQDGELQPIIADPGQIEQVIVNLVVNARDAMPHGGRLALETANYSLEVARRTDSGVLPAGDYALLRVTDTGTGMDDETRAQIFEPFFTTKETHQGTGLGLASVYGIVSQSGGQIDVETTPGEGTSFSVFFPVAEEEAIQRDAARSEKDTHGTETILLVEDATPVRRLVQRTLEKAGYKVLSAESATGALRHCGRHEGPIDLLLCDVVLPKTAGPEIARRAREIRPGLRVLFMSGFTDETLVRHGLDPAREALLEKPFTPAAILARIRTMLNEPNES
jgi:PAS domain S-box-containing protein